MNIAKCFGLALLAFSYVADAADPDVNNPAGTQGLIMIDKLAGYVRFFDPASLQDFNFTIEAHRTSLRYRRTQDGLRA
jgi:hypothetical protein